MSMRLLFVLTFLFTFLLTTTLKSYFDEAFGNGFEYDNNSQILESSASYSDNQITDEIQTVSFAREVDFGTRVTISGWVTVANQFSGPVYFQDETAGIAAFYGPLHTAVEIGDSIVISGPVTEFAPFSAPAGSFLRQIGTTQTDNVITFSVYPEGKRIVEPKDITISQMNSGDYEGQIVQISNVVINHSGNFQANTNYKFSDPSGSGQLRIDNSTNLVGATAPSGNNNILTGVVGKFNGVYQLLPRFTDDLGIEEIVVPGENVAKNQTFDIATWNIEWFGSTENGPSNNELQFQNVKTIIETMEMDVYALQEIASISEFNRLIDSLDNYNGIFAGYTQTQNTAYLYKTSTVTNLTSALVAQESSWAGGRFPFMFLFDVTIRGETKRIRTLNFHAKAFSTQSDYNQRVSDANALKAYTDSRVDADYLVILGDYNDRILSSNYANSTSPYKIFDDDPKYTIITKSLEEAGFTSFRSSSMIDHIMVNDRLYEYHFEGTERVENPNYISSYLSTTSDHYPVWTRFLFSDPVSIDQPDFEIPSTVRLEQNYPNPFNPSTTIRFTLPDADVISLKVYDVTGREVASLASNQTFSAGEHNLNFDASSLSSGIYLYRLQTTSGITLTRKMILVK